MSSDSFEDRPHYHPIGKEYLFVIQGEVIINISNEDIRLTSGEYVAMDNNTVDCIKSFTEGTIIMGVRHPSISDNKEFV